MVKISSTELYALCKTPIFEGQSPVNEDGVYHMYWRIEDAVYYTINSIF